MPKMYLNPHTNLNRFLAAKKFIEEHPDLISNDLALVQMLREVDLIIRDILNEIAQQDTSVKVHSNYWIIGEFEYTPAYNQWWDSSFADDSLFLEFAGV